MFLTIDTKQGYFKYFDFQSEICCQHPLSAKYWNFNCVIIDPTSLLIFIQIHTFNAISHCIRKYGSASWKVAWFSEHFIGWNVTCLTQSFKRFPHSSLTECRSHIQFAFLTPSELKFVHYLFPKSVLKVTGEIEFWAI